MKSILTTLFFYIFIFFSFSQVTVSGIVIDEEVNKPLPFANVYTEKGEGGISNERGQFLIEVDEMPERLIVSYVGYDNKQIALKKGELFYKIKIKPASLDLKEVEVLANDDWAATVFYEAIEKSRKLSYPLLHSKVFRRTYSTIDKNKPAELMEAFYNSTITEGGVRAFELKNGRVGIPLDNHILQLDLCKVLESYNFYGEGHGYFPKTPLQERSKKKLVKGYYIRYVGSIVSGQDTIVKINFESKNKGTSFDGVAFIDKNKKNIIRVLHQVDQAAHVPFQTVLKKNGTSVENMSIKWDTGFNYLGEVPSPRYMHLVLEMDYSDGKRKSPLRTNTKLFFYDYEKKFEMPLFGNDIELNDYDKILATPYNGPFWKRARILPETGLEERFRKDLEFNNLFLNADPYSEGVDLLNQKFQLIHENVIPNWGRVAPSKKNTYSALTKSNLGTDNYNCLYAKTFLSLDYNCFEDGSQFKAQAVLHYDESYMCGRNEREAQFFIRILDFANLNALEFEKFLVEKYKGKCPSKSELVSDLYKANKSLKKEIFLKFNGRNLRDDKYLEELKNQIGIRKNKLSGDM